MDDAPDDWADLAADPEAVTGPLPIIDADEPPLERARIEAAPLPEDTGTGPSIPLPAAA
jgi:hypothetical protein